MASVVGPLRVVSLAWTIRVAPARVCLSDDKGSLTERSELQQSDSLPQVCSCGLRSCPPSFQLPSAPRNSFAWGSPLLETDLPKPGPDPRSHSYYLLRTHCGCWAQPDSASPLVAHSLVRETLRLHQLVSNTNTVSFHPSQNTALTAVQHRSQGQHTLASGRTASTIPPPFAHTHPSSGNPSLPSF